MKWRDTRNSHLEQAYSSAPKVKKQTDVNSLNSLLASPTTRAENSLSIADKMKKIVVWLSASSRVSWLQVWKQMHSWLSLPMTTSWWWEQPQREVEKKVLKDQLLFWKKKKSKVVNVKIQIQWILFHGKLKNWDWTRRADTTEILRMHLGQNWIREKKAIWRHYPKRWTSWAKSLRACFWGITTWGDLTTSSLY